MSARSFEFGADYPGDRIGKLWAFHVIKLLAVPMVAQGLGANGCNLIRVIATLEDDQFYSGAVLATDENLRPMLAVTEKTLVTARRRCIQAGWLHYEPGEKGSPSRMWVKIPQSVDLRLRSNIQWKNSTTTGTRTGTTTGTTSGTTTGITTDPSYIPIPTPKPLPGEAGFEKSSEEEIQKTNGEDKTSFEKKSEESERQQLEAIEHKQLVIDWERVYGPRLDEMPDDKLVEIASRAFPIHAAAFEKFGVRNRLVRPIVLQALAGFFNQLHGVR